MYSGGNSGETIKRSASCPSCGILSCPSPLVCLSVPGFAASGKLIVYTSQLEADAQQTVDAFKKVCPGIDVQWTRTGTSELMNKLRAEFTAGKPQPDVILIADMVTMEGLKREGRLMAYRAAPIKGYAKGLYDTDGYYFSTKIISTGIIYNDKAPFKPESIKDLIRPDAKGMVIMPSPLYSGAAAIHMHTLTQNPSLGWQIYEELAKNKAVNSKGNGGTFKAVASGEKIVRFLHRLPAYSHTNFRGRRLPLWFPRKEQVP